MTDPYRLGGRMTDPSERNSYGLTWDEEKALHAEMLLAANREANEERERANKAVQAALAGYRWWGFSNILSTLRLWVAAWRFARNLKRAGR